MAPDDTCLGQTSGFVGRFSVTTDAVMSPSGHNRKVVIFREAKPHFRCSLPLMDIGSYTRPKLWLPTMYSLHYFLSPRFESRLFASVAAGQISRE